MNELRLQNEREHGKFIAKTGEQIWNWSSPAGKLRWQKRCDMFRDFLGTSSQHVLEVGCGTGLFTQELADSPNNIVSIDISPELIELAQKRVKHSNVTFRAADACDTGFSDQTFDAIVGISVLHHLECDDALGEFSRLLKPSGKLWFSEPNMMNPQIALQKNIPWIKAWSGDSLDETAFFRWTLRQNLFRHHFDKVNVTPFDFLHPGIPRAFLPLAKPFTAFLEHVPLIKEISGSLAIQAVKEEDACSQANHI